MCSLKSLNQNYSVAYGYTASINWWCKFVLPFWISIENRLFEKIKAIKSISCSSARVFVLIISCQQGLSNHPLSKSYMNVLHHRYYIYISNLYWNINLAQLESTPNGPYFKNSLGQLRNFDPLQTSCDWIFDHVFEVDNQQLWCYCYLSKYSVHKWLTNFRCFQLITRFWNATQKCWTTIICDFFNNFKKKNVAATVETS